MRKQTLWTGVLVLCLSASALLVCRAEEPTNRVRENERKAIGAMRTLNTALVTYAHLYKKDRGFTCKLAELGPPPVGEKDSAQAANLIAASLAMGEWDGFKFELKCPSKSTPQKTYQTTAVPLHVGKTGQRAFCSDESAIIKASEDGKGATCLAKGAPLQ